MAGIIGMSRTDFKAISGIRNKTTTNTMIKILINNQIHAGTKFNIQI